MNTARNVGKWIAIGSFYVWLIETIVFLFIDGWHYESTRPIEQLFDKASIMGIRLGIGIYVGAILILIDKIFDKIKKEKIEL
jgi:hypothetical protein